MESTPATYNPPAFVPHIDARLRKVFGQIAVVPVAPIMGAEGFERYGPVANCPSYIFCLGVAAQNIWHAAQLPDGVPGPGMHNSLFAPEAPLPIQTGVTAMREAVLELLPVNS